MNRPMLGCPEVVRNPGGAALLVALLGCATPGAAEIRGLAAQGAVDELVALEPRLAREADRVALLRALAPHAADPAATALLLEAAGPGRSTRIRAAALEALGEAGVERADGALVDALGDPHPSVRAAATQAVLARGLDLWARLERAARVDPNPLVRAGSLRVMTREARARPELVEPAGELAARAATDAAPVVRLEAMRGLGALAWGPGRPVLAERLRTDPSREVRMAAEAALEQVGRDPSTPRPTVAVLPLRVGGPDPGGRLARLAERVATITRARLSASAGCEVIDRERMDDVLRELRKRGQLVYDGDAVNAPAIGAFKVANQLVYGSVLREGPVHTIVLQRLDVSTMALVPGAAVTLSGYAHELEGLVDEAVERFARGFR